MTSENELKGKEELANSGSYQPCLCYVTTDGNGSITEIKQFKAQYDYSEFSENVYKLDAFSKRIMSVDDDELHIGRCITI